MEETRSLILETYPDAIVEIGKLDVTDEALVDQFYSNKAARFGSIDYAANVAGAPQAAAPIHENTAATFDKVFAVNQKGVREPDGSNILFRKAMKYTNYIGLSV